MRKLVGFRVNFILSRQIYTIFNISRQNLVLHPPLLPSHRVFRKLVKTKIKITQTKGVMHEPAKTGPEEYLKSKQKKGFGIFTLDPDSGVDYLLIPTEKIRRKVGSFCAFHSIYSFSVSPSP